MIQNEEVQEIHKTSQDITNGKSLCTAIDGEYTISILYWEKY